MDYKFLGQINDPADLKKLNIAEAEELCEEIRTELISTVSQNGGHLASNLGVVELTVALHRVYESPSDTVIFDVGHQCYPHKMLTGRFQKFCTIRQKGGLSGFMRPDESEHDPFITGHARACASGCLISHISNSSNQHGSCAADPSLPGVLSTPLLTPPHLPGITGPSSHSEHRLHLTSLYPL